MLRREFKIKNLNRPFYGWDVVDNKLVTQEDATHIEDEYRFHTIQFKHLIATPFIVRLADDNTVYDVTRSHDIDVVVIEKDGHLMDIIYSRGEMEEKLQKIGVNDEEIEILSEIFVRQYRLYTRIAAMYDENGVIKIKDGKAYVLTNLVKYKKYVLAMDWSNYIPYNKVYLDIRDIVVKSTEFIVYRTQSDMLLVTPTEYFLEKCNMDGKRLKDIFAITPRYSNYAIIDAVKEFYRKIGKQPSVLMVDRNPTSIVEFGVTEDGSIVTPCDGKNMRRIYDHYGIELYETDAAPVNTIRMSSNGKVSRYIINNSDITVIYSYDGRDVEVLALMDGENYKIYDAANEKQRKAIKEIHRNIENIMKRDLRYIVKQIPTQLVYKVRKILSDWTIEADVIKPIGNTELGYIVKDTINLKEYIRNNKHTLEVLEEDNEKIVILRKDNVVEAFIAPSKAKKMGQELKNLHAVEFEVDIQPEKIDVLVRRAIIGAKKKLLNNVGTDPIEKIIDELKKIDNLKFTIEDAILAGNYEYEIELFIQRKGLKEKEYLTLNEILNLIEDEDERYRHAIENTLRYKYAQYIYGLSF